MVEPSKAARVVSLCDSMRFQGARMPDLSDYDTDPENCGACDAVNDMCPYHRGIEDGIAYMREVVEALSELPDEFDALLQAHRKSKGGGR